MSQAQMSSAVRFEGAVFYSPHLKLAQKQEHSPLPDKLLNFSGNGLAACATAQSNSNPCLENKKLQKWRHQLPRKDFCL